MLLPHYFASGLLRAPPWDGKIEGEENLFEQAINAIKARYDLEFGMLGDDAKKDLEDPTVVGFKLFNNMDKVNSDILTILLNPYAFSRITLEEWCVAAERFMIKQTKGTTKWKCRVTIIQKLDDWSTRSNWRSVNVLLPLPHLSSVQDLDVD